MPNVGPVEILIVILIVVMVVIVPLVVLRVVLREANEARPPQPAQDPAMTTLRVRLAKGEIDPAEYERLRSTLLHH